MPSEGRVTVLPRVAWRRRVGELITEWFTAIRKANESATAARDSSRRDLQRVALERPEIFYKDSVSFGENLHRIGKGLFQEAVKESTGILSAMMRRGCTVTASSSKEDVADFVRFLETKFEKYKRFALDGPMQGRESATTDETREAQTPPSPVREVARTPSGATKRVSPNPERMGEHAKKPARQKSRAAPPTDADVEESEATASEGSSKGPTLAEGARRAKSKAKAKSAPATLATQNAFCALEGRVSRRERGEV